MSESDSKSAISDEEFDKIRSAVREALLEMNGRPVTIENTIALADRASRLCGRVVIVVPESVAQRRCPDRIPKEHIVTIVISETTGPASTGGNA